MAETLQKALPGVLRDFLHHGEEVGRKEEHRVFCQGRKEACDPIFL